MPYIRDWDPEDFEQLKLGLYELTSFEAYAVGGIRKAHIELDQHLPTSLHSISNQLYPCSCGCRPGFSLQRLQRDGLYGVLIPLESQVFHESQFHQECRYPHPNEIFLMNGGDPKVNFSPHMRLALAGIGQCVSPIQGLWVLSQVHHALCKLQNSSVVDPRQTLEQYVQQVLVSRDQLWPSLPAPTVEANCSIIQVVDRFHHTKLDTKIPQGCTLRAFLEAEATLCQDRDRANIDVFAGNVLLTPDDILNDLSQIVLGASTAIVPHDMPTCPCCEWESNGSHEMPPPCRHPSPTPMCQPSGSEPWPSISPTLPYMVENNGVPGDAIAQLGGTDLLLLVPPRIASVNGITAHLECKLSQSTRMMILQHQGEIWADDEIRFGLSTLALKSQCDYLFAWDPLFVSSLIRYGSDMVI